MKILFDPAQEFQLHAIRAVVESFAGQRPAGGAFEWQADALAGDLLTELAAGNRLDLTEAQVEANVRRVQAENFKDHPEAARAEVLGAPWAGMNFSVEMETGTGKTYVYLRTILELHARYGWRKFIVVVPSVELMRDHFRALYANVPIEAWTYDSAQVSRLRHFATSPALQLLVINIQAFDKTTNILNNPNDRLSGRRPIEFLQSANPVVVLDEPQNLESERAKAAIASLGPLCTLRYSATHRNVYNLLHQLDPVRAFGLKLVKAIEVDSVREEGDFNRPYVRFKKASPGAKGITAKVELDVQTAADGVQRKDVTLKHGDDLAKKTGRALYTGLVVRGINATPGAERLDLGQFSLGLGEGVGVLDDAIQRVQVRQTILKHFEKELTVARLPVGQRMKVLSLFFLDRVAHYAADDGKVRGWFAEEYEAARALPQFAGLALPPVAAVHAGYFASRDGVAIDSKEKSTQADEAAFELIMRGKERLLSLDEPVRFIFSHSALREGWDNPNVFQICSLREMSTERERRQTLGRGLRLPVREDGTRCHDATLNRLTLVASEDFEDFARGLQAEFAEAGVRFETRLVHNARKRRKLNLRKGWDADPEFLALWERIKHRTRYSVTYETARLVTEAAAAIRARPDTITTELTRTTLAAILARSGRLGDALVNPQQFVDLAAGEIEQKKRELLVQGVQYERLSGADASWEMMWFRDKELEPYLERIQDTPQRGLYDGVECDSEVERKFAEQLDARADIKLFVKLPWWFKVETPVGDYNPDWAIVREVAGEPPRLYLVRETKSTGDFSQLEKAEQDKIACGKRHFKALGFAPKDYEWTDSAAKV
ncbi:MAG: DEAD/DEAH box helicase family protein [Opitutae bacterium]|nr:DEAD/DEAH box helicase family protein [Opitutae bacterium]